MPSTRRDVEVWHSPINDEVESIVDSLGDRLFLRAAENNLGNVIMIYVNHSNPALPADNAILERADGGTLVLGPGHGLYPVGIIARIDNNFDAYWMESGTILKKQTVTPNLIKVGAEGVIMVPNTSKGIIDVLGSSVILTDQRPFVDVGSVRLQDAMGRLHLIVGVLGENNWVILYDANQSKFFVLDDSGQNQLHPRLAVSVLTGQWKVGLSYGPGHIISTPLREYQAQPPDQVITKLNQAIALIEEAKGLIGS